MRRIHTCSLVLAAFLVGFAPVAPTLAGEDAPRVADAKTQAAELAAAFRSDSFETRLDAIEAATGVQHDSLTVPLVRLLADKERTIREAAIRALAARESKAAKKKASSSLAARLPRLAKDETAKEELLQVVEALGVLAQPAAVKALLDDITLDTDIEIVRARFMAVAEIPDKRAIEGLIDFLAKGRRGGAGPQRDAARKALQYATGVNAGREMTKAGKDADRWRAWWRENKKDFDFEGVKAAREEAQAEAKAKADRKEAQKEKRRRAKEERRKKKAAGGGAKPRDADA